MRRRAAGWLKLLFSDSGEVSSKRVAGILCCLAGVFSVLGLEIADVGFRRVADRLTYESIDSLFWASFAFLGVNAVTQGIATWRSGGK